MKFLKTIFRFGCLLAFSLSSVAVSAQASVAASNYGQKLEVKQGRNVLAPNASDIVGIPAAAALTFNVLDPNNTVPNQPCDGQLNQNCGWYKGFWIFGDGNYLKYDDNVTPMDAGTRTYPNYAYARAGTYNPVVYLTEKYNNENPPEAARATINLPAASVVTGFVETTRRLANSPKLLDIDYNQNPRPKYPVNFVLSYRKTENAKTVLFYYNGIKDGADWSTIVPFTVLEPQRVTPGGPVKDEPAAYQTASYGPQDRFELPVNFGSGQGIIGTLLDPLNLKFKNVLAYSVSAPDQNFIQNLTELRVFPVFNTVPITEFPGDSIPLKPTAFVAILLGSEPVNDPKLLTLARELTGNSDLQLNKPIRSDTNLYIRDIQYMEMGVLKSHDPNSLTVVDIRDLGNGKYRVYFRLVICNKGELAESNMSVTFNDLTGGRYPSRPDNLKGIDLDGIAQIWSLTAPWKVQLPGYQISGVPDEYNPSCKESFFTMDTDQAGVAQLYQDSPRALQVCVDFSAGEGECSENEPLSEGKYLVDGKYLPVDPATRTTEGGDWIIWAVLILVLIGILWYWYSKKDE